MCNKPLRIAYLTIQSKNGPLMYGPKCARRSGKLNIKTRTKKHKPEAQEIDPRQMELL
jgi:hypothetical protein